jgi:twitching motility two-component system response regulator PilG
MTYSANTPSAQPPQQHLASPAKTLHKLVTEERSGRLTLTEPNDSSIQWCVYFGGGQIHFAGSTMGWTERLTHLFYRESAGLETSLNPEATSDYRMICECWRERQLPLNWVRQLLAQLTQEALAHFLAIPQGQISYEPIIGLDPLLLSMPFRQLVLPIRETVTEWAKLRNEISSPFQRPYIQDQDKYFQMALSDGNLGQQFQDLSHLLDSELTLYDIAHQLSISALELAVLLQPLIQAGAIGVSPYQVFVSAPKRPVVACVDDSPTIQQFVKLSLESAGYDVLALSDPTVAVPHLLKHQPRVILMDIEMPKMDGYELCRQARQQEDLRSVPIVMLTGREGIIDRVRAKMAGCTAYLTKPFNPQELLDLVEKLAQAQPVPSI